MRSDRTEIIDDIHKKLKQLKKSFKEHILFVIEKYGHIDYIWADCAEKILISALQEALDELHLHIPIKDSIKTPISSRIYAINMLMMLGKIKFVENDTKGIVTSLQEASVYYQQLEADACGDRRRLYDERRHLPPLPETVLPSESGRRCKVQAELHGMGNQLEHGCGLLEGMAGFGTAVAIPAAILIGLGFKPMFSALVSLIFFSMSA